MFSSIKSFFKFGKSKNVENNKNSQSLLFIFFLGIVEDILFWRKLWLSLIIFFLFNVIFILFVSRQLNLLQFIFGFSILLTSIDALETWLKYKHRMSCLKRLASRDSRRMEAAFASFYCWIERKWNGYIYLRNVNHTKAFLLLQIILSLIFIIGKYTSGYTLIYLLCTLMFLSQKMLPPLMRIVKKLQQSAESDFELEGLIPEESEINLDLLSIEPSEKIVKDEKQSLDYWKPEDLHLEDVSDSSDNSSSLVRNLSIGKMQPFDKEDVEVTDSSEDEYIPQEQNYEKFQSSLEVQPVGTWGSSAYNVLSNLSGAVASMVYHPQDEKKRERVSSIDSSDGFEIIDKNEIM